jgi:protein TonB
MRYSRSDVYPDIARRQNLQGTVVLAFVVERDGSIQHVAVIESSGYAVLDEAAAGWIEKGGFHSPATLDGQPVRELLYFPVQFKLTGPQKIK